MTLDTENIPTVNSHGNELKVLHDTVFTTEKNPYNLHRFYRGKNYYTKNLVTNNFLLLASRFTTVENTMGWGILHNFTRPLTYLFDHVNNTTELATHERRNGNKLTKTNDKEEMQRYSIDFS